MRSWRRPVAIWLLVAFLVGLLSPALEAQGARPTPAADDDALVANVQETLATRESVAASLGSQQARRDEALRAAAELRALAAPPGEDPGSWQATLERRAAELEAWARENDELARRSQERLGKSDAELRGLRGTLQGSASERVRGLGDLVETALREPLFATARPAATSPVGVKKPAYDSLSLTMGTNAVDLGGGDMPGKVAMSVAQAYWGDVVGQLSSNGWNPAKVDWGRRLQPMRTPQFWGGVGGAFVGALGGSALANAVPGSGALSTVLRFSMSTLGAAVGCQVGSGGSLRDVDWHRFWLTSAGGVIGKLVCAPLGPMGAWLGAFVGGTIGSQLGSGLSVKDIDWTRLLVASMGALAGRVLCAPLGPMGAWFGGFVGGALADWALRVWRDWRSAPHAATTRPVEATAAGSFAPEATPPLGAAGGADLSRLADERRVLYDELLAAMNAPAPDPARVRELRDQLLTIDVELARRRAGAVGP